MNLDDFFDGVSFREEDHTYFFNGECIKRTASQIYNWFVKPFEAEKIALGVSKRTHEPVERVLEKWDYAKKKSCELGTKVHLFGERYAKNRTLKPQNGYEIAITKFWNRVPKNVEIVALEKVMYHKELKYAGTADIVLYNNITKKYIVGDYKTNSNIFKNYKGARMLEPFGNLLDMPLNHYQIQLSLYQMLLEQVDDVKVSIRRLIWLRDDGTFKIIDTDDYTSLLKKELKKRL